MIVPKFLVDSGARASWDSYLLSAIAMASSSVFLSVTGSLEFFPRHSEPLFASFLCSLFLQPLMIFLVHIAGSLMIFLVHIAGSFPAPQKASRTLQGAGSVYPLCTFGYINAVHVSAGLKVTTWLTVMAYTCSPGSQEGTARRS